MILRSVEIRSFRCIRNLHVEFSEGLNVLYGPNELGKSTLVEALRAAFLLPVNSRVADDFIPWESDETPQVLVEFDTSDRKRSEGAAPVPATTRWKVSKSFGRGRAASSLLERVTSHGRSVPEARGRNVEGRLRSLLDWGIQGPGGRRAPRGWPQSYLVTALLGEQDGISKIFETSLDSDGTESGRNRLTSALGVLAQAPEVSELLDRLSLRVGEVYTDKGKKRRTQDSPLVRITEQILKQQNRVEKLEAEERKSTEIEDEIARLRNRQQQADKHFEQLNREVKLLDDVIKQREIVKAGEDLKRNLDEAAFDYEQADKTLQDMLSQRQAAEERCNKANEDLARHEERLKQSADSQGKSLESRRRQLEADSQLASQRKNEAQRVFNAAHEVDEQRKIVHQATQTTEAAQTHLRQAECTLWRVLEQAVKQAERHVTRAAAVTELAELNVKRDQLVASLDIVKSAEQDFRRLSRETNQTVEEFDRLKSKRTDLQKARDSSLDLAKQTWEQREKLAAHHRQLEESYRKAEAAEQKARNYLNDLDRFDDVNQRLSETKRKQNALIAEQETSEQQRLQVADELATVSRSVSLWQMTAMGCAAGAFVTLMLAIVIASGRGFLLSVSGLLGIACTALAFRWHQSSNRRNQVRAERDTIRHALDRLASQTLITDSELDAAQREIDMCQRSLPSKLLTRFDSLSDARAWLEEKLSEAAEKQSRLEQELEAHEQHETGPVLDADHDNPALTLDAQIQALDEQIAVAEEATRAARTQRDQAQVRHEQAMKAVPTVEFEGDCERWRRLLESQIAKCMEQLNWPANLPIPNIEEAANEELLARQQLIKTTSDYSSRKETLAAEAHSDSYGEELDEVSPDISVEDAEQRLRHARDHFNAAEDERKQQQADLKAKETTADRLSEELEKPADEVLAEMNQMLSDYAEQFEQLDVGTDTDAKSVTEDRDTARDTEAPHQDAVRKLKEDLKDIDDAVANLQEARDEAGSQRAKAETEAQLIDIDAAKSELRSLEQALCRDFPDRDASSEQLESSKERQADAQRKQNEINKSLHEARGKLELSGGEVLREKLDESQAELERIKADAIELELEYDALNHLLEQLTQTSQRHSAHLGKSLSRPVIEQFRTLTGERYVDLQLDSDLQLKKVSARNSERSPDSMSVGTRHQLATLIRIALAAHLQTTVVLDDQLVHSDTDRLLWFRDRLRQSVKEQAFQAVVVTCRPLDYISEQELKNGSHSDDASGYGTCNLVNLAASVGADIRRASPNDS